MTLQQQSSLQPVRWAEFISRQGSMFNGSFSWDRPSQFSYPIDVGLDDGNEWQDLLVAVYSILGSAEKDGTKIARKLPMQHPVFTNFWAISISNVAFLGFREKVEFEKGPVSTHQIARLTVVFGNLPYVLLDDGELAKYYPGKEYYRFVAPERKPTSEAIQRVGGALKWREGPADGYEIPYPTAQAVNKEELVLTWYMVPEDGLFDSAGNPSNVDSCRNKVNDDTFLGRPAGTLLMMPPQYFPMDAPFPIEGIPIQQPSRLWKVRLTFKHFDPRYGATARGHNLLPHPKDGKWYKVSSADSASELLYPEADFETIFQMCTT